MVKLQKWIKNYIIRTIILVLIQDKWKDKNLLRRWVFSNKKNYQMEFLLNLNQILNLLIHRQDSKKKIKEKKRLLNNNNNNPQINTKLKSHHFIHIEPIKDINSHNNNKEVRLIEKIFNRHKIMYNLTTIIKINKRTRMDYIR